MKTHLLRVSRPTPAPRVEIVRVPEKTGAAELLQHFLDGKTPNTLDAYTRDLGAFAKYLGTDSAGAVAMLLGCTRGQGNALALSWLNAMKAQGASSATRARRLSTLRSLTQALENVDALSWSVRVRSDHVETYRDTRGPTEETIHQMFAQCGVDLRGLRNQVLLGLLFPCALRRFEVVGLRFRDYDRLGARLRVFGKGGKEAWVDIPPELAVYIERWVQAAGISEAGAPLVQSLSRPGEALSKDSLDRIVSDIGKKIGVKVWPHGLRHAAITAALDRGHDPRSVQRVSRHKDIRTLFRYDDNRRRLGAPVVADLAREFLLPQEE